jgi:RNA-binding protein 39
LRLRLLHTRQLTFLSFRARLRQERREAELRARELEELDRDVRTVFAYNVSTKADERDLFEFFSGAGTVLDVRIIYDRNTPKSKGMAYIEMAKREDVGPALALSGTPLRGQMVMVKASEAEKNIAWEAEKAAKAAGGAGSMVMLPTTGASGLGQGQAGTLRVSGLHPSLTDGDVRAVFEPFGPVTHVAMNPGGVVGDAEVTYASGATAAAAMQQLNGLDLAGTALRVTLAVGVMAPAAAGNGANVTGPAGAAQPGFALASAGELDDEGEGIKLDSRSRAALMAKLAGNAGQSMVAAIDPRTGLPITAASALAPSGPALPAAAMPTMQGRLGPASPIATECLLLKNMFDAASETEPDWWIDIGQEVKEECSRFGPVRHVFVDKNSAGFVYLRFETVAASAAAQQALHTRWFAGRMIAAEFQFVALYSKEWEESAH